MKRFSAVFPVLLFSMIVNAQELTQVAFSGGSTFSYFSFIVNNDVLIRISDDGRLIEWGREIQSIRSDNYATKLEPYLGRVEYYGPETDSAIRGKIRSIGTISITYYRSYETETNVGKLRTIGSQLLDYYTSFENEAIRGKLRFIGSIILSYYPSYEDEGFRGKLKSLDNADIKYHSSFDDKMIRGKVKSIGPVKIEWNTSFDRYGGIKSGVYRQNVLGVTYILR